MRFYRMPSIFTALLLVAFAILPSQYALAAIVRLGAADSARSLPATVVVYPGFSTRYDVETDSTHRKLHLYVNLTNATAIADLAQVDCQADEGQGLWKLVPLGTSLGTGNNSGFLFPSPDLDAHPELRPGIPYPICAGGAQVTGVYLKVAVSDSAPNPEGPLQLTITQETSSQPDRGGSFSQQPSIALQDSTTGALLSSIPIGCTFRAEWHTIHPIPGPVGEFYDVVSEGNSLVTWDRNRVDLRAARFGYTYELRFNLTFAPGNMTVIPVIASTLVSPADCDQVTTFGKFGTTQCVPCPEDMFCNGTVETRVKGSFWRPNNRSVHAYSCEPPFMIYSCQEDTTTGACVEGHTGPRCSVCQPGYGWGSRFCSKCPSRGEGIAYVVLTAVILLVVISVMTASTMDCPKADHLPLFIRIFMNHNAVASIIGEFYSHVPTEMEAVLSLQREFSRPSPRSAAMQCTTGMSWYDMFIVVNVLPFVLVIVIGTLITLHKSRQSAALEEEEEEAKEKEKAARGSEGADAICTTPAHLDGFNERSQIEFCESAPGTTSHKKAEEGDVQNPLLEEPENVQPASATPPPQSQDGSEGVVQSSLLEEPKNVQPASATPPPQSQDGSEAVVQSSLFTPPPQSPTVVFPDGVECSFGDDIHSSGTQENNHEDSVKTAAHDIPHASSTTNTGPTIASPEASAVALDRPVPSDPSVAGADGETKVTMLPEFEVEEPDTFDVSKQDKIHIFAVTSIVIVFTLYPSVVGFCASSLKCDVIDESIILDNGTVTGGEVSYFYYDRARRCDSTEHRWYQAFGAILGVFWGLGTPLMALGLYAHLRRPIEKGGIGNVDASRLFTFLVAGYRSQVWWWEGTVMLRKAAMIFVLNFVPTPPLQTVASAWVLTISLAANVVITPYDNGATDNLERASLFSMVIVLNIGMLVDTLTRLGYMGNDASDRSDMEAVAWIVFTINVVIAFTLLVRVLLEMVRKIRKTVHECRSDIIQWKPGLEGCVKTIEWRPVVRFVYDKKGRAIPASSLTPEEREQLGIDLHEEEPTDWSDNETETDDENEPEEEEELVEVPETEAGTEAEIPGSEEPHANPEGGRKPAARGFNVDELITYDPTVLQSVGGAVAEAIKEQEKLMAKMEDDAKQMKKRIEALEATEVKQTKKISLITEFATKREAEELALVQSLIDKEKYQCDSRTQVVEHKRDVLTMKYKLNTDISALEAEDGLPGLLGENGVPGESNGPERRPRLPEDDDVAPAALPEDEEVLPEKPEETEEDMKQRMECEALLQRKELEISTLKGNIASLNTDLAAMRGDLSDHLESSRMELSQKESSYASRTKDLEKERENLEVKLAALQKDLDIARNTAAVVTDELATSQQKISMSEKDWAMEIEKLKKDHQEELDRLKQPESPKTPRFSQVVSQVKKQPSGRWH